MTPLTPLVFSSYHWLQGEPDRLASPARRAVAMSPKPSMLDIIAGWQLDAGGCRAEGADALRRTAAAHERHVLGAWASFQERALAGDEAGALAHEAGLRDTLRNEFAAIMMAEACALLGRSDDAVRWVRTAIEFGFVNHPYLSQHSRHLASIRGNSGFQELLRDVERRWRELVAWEQTRG